MSWTNSRAVISECGTYRYQLRRTWDTLTGAGTVLWVMLNPSTADANNDDPTIKRCIGYAKAWGYAGIEVGNVYAYRATDPTELFTGVLLKKDICGPDNDRHLIEMANRPESLIVIAWGAHVAEPDARHTLNLLAQTGKRIWRIGLTKDGHPWHPLYKLKGLKPVEHSTSIYAGNDNG